ncbi:Ion-trans-2 domain-containing protein [Aphelenchoides bicaudatus]|nr:Ion-trans-2 domain-containing protein [Aphelenchoides bicaudatus]
MAYTFLPRFHLAFRRTLFYLIFLAIYLFAGSMVFFILWRKGSPIKPVSATTERLDFERTELLNVLYAEAIGRTEHDWVYLANQKLDSYERSLLEHADSGAIQAVRQRNISLGYAFRYAFYLLTTIGPVDIDDLSIEIKAISSALPGLKNLILTSIAVLFVVAIIHDIVEQGSDDTPFIDAILTVYLTVTTIGCEDDKDELPSVLLYVVGLFSLSVFSILFSSIQHEIENVISPYELGFTQSYAHLERALSGHRIGSVGGRR